MAAPVAVVVVNYNAGPDLPECLAALCAAAAAGPGADILVVDNASTDDSLAVLEDLARRHPAIRVLTSPVNRGYAGAVNLALPHVEAPYLAVLNPDVVVDRGWLTDPVTLLDARPQVAAVNPLILLHDDPARINAAGQDVHVTGLGFNRWLGRPRAHAGTAPLPVSGIQGAAVILRRSALVEAGGWDERGFLYHEDVELSWLLQLLGYDLVCLPGSTVRHKYRLSMYPGKLFLLERNRLGMMLAHLRWRSLLLLAPLLLATEGLVWGYCLLRGGAFLRAKARSYTSVAARWPEHRARRRWIHAARRRSDWAVVRRLRWGYAWDQFRVLAREGASAIREPAGGLPLSV